jgi:hypothetical protein
LGRLGLGTIKMKTVVALALAVATAVPGVVAAQDTSARAISGSYTLRSGFTPDPFTVRVTAGGSIDAYGDTPLPAACVGKISNAPDIEITYTAGSLPLVFRTRSSSDTTLIINGPDGSWYCDDDSWGDGDAQVYFSKPSSGTYDVWIGKFSSGTASATLLVTETP